MKNRVPIFSKEIVKGVIASFLMIYHGSRVNFGRKDFVLKKKHVHFSMDTLGIHLIFKKFYSK